LDSCLDRPEEIGLILHMFSVTIYDYANHAIDIYYPSERRELFEDHAIENGIRRLFASFLPAFSSVMIHSAGLILNERAAIFLASDGGGKTTVLKRASVGTVLCDDQNVLRIERDIATAHSTPWGAFNYGPRQAKIGAFFLLEKGADFELSPIKPWHILTFLSGEHALSWHLLPRSLRAAAFEILGDICYQVPAYRMRFPKDYVNWDAIAAAMAK
jgi:hypothetical protein